VRQILQSINDILMCLLGVVKNMPPGYAEANAAPRPVEIALGKSDKRQLLDMVSGPDAYRLDSSNAAAEQLDRLAELAEINIGQVPGFVEKLGTLPRILARASEETDNLVASKCVPDVLFRVS
jgi:hypothetical protein